MDCLHAGNTSALQEYDLQRLSDHFRVYAWGIRASLPFGGDYTKGAANSRLSGVYPPGSSAPAICHGPEWSDHHDLPSLHCRVFCADAEKCKSNEEK